MKEDVHTHLKRVLAVQEWPVPQIVKQLKSFLGSLAIGGLLRDMDQLLGHLYIY